MPDPPGLPKTRRGIVGGVFLLPLLTALTHISGRTRFSAAFPFAEMLTGAVITRDLVNGGRLEDWVLPEAPYIVPDWLIWFGLEGADVEPGVSVWLFGVIQLSLLLALWIGIARHGPRGLRHPGVLLAPFLLWLIIMSGADPAAFALVSFWRFGTVLMTFACLLITLEMVTTDRRPRHVLFALLLAITIAAAHVSDEAIAAWFTLPASFTLVVLWRRSVLPRSSAALWGLAVAAGHVAGLVIEPRVGIRLDDYQAWISPTAITHRLREFVRVYNIEFGLSPLASALAVVGIIISAHRIRRGTLGPVEQFLAWYLLSATAVGIGAQLFLGGESPLGSRMMTHVVVLSILAVGYETATMLRWVSVPPALRWIALLIVSFMIVGRITPHAERDIGLAVEFEDVACVEHALEPYAGEHGVASFVSQNTIIFYADLDLRITNAWDVDPATIEASSWPHNTTWRVDRPAFVIADDWSYQDDPWPILTRQPVVARYGEPTSEVDCARWLVLLYG